MAAGIVVAVRRVINRRPNVLGTVKRALVFPALSPQAPRQCPCSLQQERGSWSLKAHSTRTEHHTAKLLGAGLGGR